MTQQIYIKTTESCNLKCKHCYIGKFRNQPAFFNEEKTIAWLKAYLSIFKINEEDILISFHGGEPFLCPLEKLESITKAFPKANFNATSNLVYDLNEKHMNFIKKNFYDSYNKTNYIKTSWDYKIRFSTLNQLELWEANIKKLQENNIDVTVTICLTSLLIKEVDPRDLLQYFYDLDIKSLNFERLTSNTTSKKSLIPDYSMQDDYLYELFKINEELFKINIVLFEDIKRATNEVFDGCRKRKCMQEVITINADGSIGGCPNTALIEPFSSINKNPLDLIKNQCRDCLIKKENLRQSGCYTCDLFQFCNGDCHQLSWQGNICPAPKKIFYHLIPKNKLTSIEDEDDRAIRLLESSIWSYNINRIENPKQGDIENLKNKDLPLDFIFPKDISYKTFKESKFGKIENLNYYAINLPLDYYKTHLVKDNQLYYDNNTWTSSDKSHKQVQDLIDDIAKEGFNCPLCFRLCRNGQLCPMACNTRLFIARYLDLPYIPAIILIGGDFDDLGQKDKDFRDLANKYLSPFVIL